MMSDEPDDFDADYDEGLAGIEDEELNEEEQLTEGEPLKESRALQFLNTHHPECRLDYIDEILQRLPLGS